MKRLIVTGLPCPPSVWEEFFSPSTLSESCSPSIQEQKIICLADVLEHSTSSDLRVMSRYVTQQIESFQPNSIVSHGFGVSMTLMSLLRLNRRATLDMKEMKVTLFNGAFRNIDIFKTYQPLRAQYMSYGRAVREVQKQKGEVDERLRPHSSRIRAIYRRVILVSLMEKASSLFGIASILDLGKSLPIKNPIQIIASTNDPYLPFDAIERMKRDFPAKRFIELEYGHFPYSIHREKILPLVEEFENGSFKNRATKQIA